MLNIYKKGVKVLKTTKHGKRKGDGFYASFRLDVAKGYTKFTKKDDNIRSSIVVLTTKTHYDSYTHNAVHSIKKAFTELVFRKRSCIREKIKVLYIIIEDSTGSCEIIRSKRK